jgi:glycosyltransferase involved in cell wall biosynthesis
MVEWVRDNGLKGAVEFAGFVSGRKKAQILLHSSIFVLPSYREGCPGALFKAMGAGLPPITTGVGGISDIVVDRKNDILLDKLRVPELSAAITLLIKDARLRKHIRGYNRKESWEQFRSSVVASRIEAVYREVSSH